MSVETWGLMPKSQIDPETVEEAITRLIGVHEHDPTSHLGENESIEAHRTSEVIDHLKDSIVSDKFSQTDKAIITYYEDISHFISGGDFGGSFLFLSCIIRGDDVVDSYGYSESLFFSCDANDNLQEQYIDFNFRISNSTNIAIPYIGMNVQDAVPDYGYHLLIKIENDKIYYGFANDGAISWTMGETMYKDTRYMVRFATNKINNSADIYLNGVLKFSEFLAEGSAWSVNSFGIYLDKIGGTTNAQWYQINSRFLAYGNPTL